MPYRRPLGGGGSTPVQKFKFCSQRALKRSKMAKSSKDGLSPKFPRFSPGFLARYRQTEVTIDISGVAALCLCQ